MSSWELNPPKQKSVNLDGLGGRNLDSSFFFFTTNVSRMFGTGTLLEQQAPQRISFPIQVSKPRWWSSREIERRSATACNCVLSCSADWHSKLRYLRIFYHAGCTPEPKLGTYSDWGLSSVLVINKHLSHLQVPSSIPAKPRELKPI